jgi:hypothetical protein
MTLEENVTEFHAIAIRMEVLAVLRDDESPETLSMIRKLARFDDYLVCVAAIQPNTTLKSPRLLPLYDTKKLILVLKENYRLEAIPRLRQDGTGDVRSILQLNGAGRRYLVQDGSSITKGVDVLI